MIRIEQLEFRYAEGDFALQIPRLEIATGESPTVNLPLGEHTITLTVADGKLYAVSQHKGTYVLAAKPEFELLAHNVFEDDNSLSNACPVVSNNQLLIRSDKYLSCIGKEAAGK